MKTYNSNNSKSALLRLYPACIVALIIFLGFANGLVANCCTLNVREAGFLNNMGGPYYPVQYRLVMIAATENDKTKKLNEALAKLNKEELEGSNLSVVLFTADKIDPRDREYMKEDGIDLTKLPQTFIFSQANYDRNVIFTEQRLFSIDEIRSFLNSPAKKRLQKLLTDNNNYSVAMLITGNDKQANKQAEKVVKDGLNATKSMLPKQKVPFFEVSLTDPKEKNFLRELAVSTNDVPAMAMVFGKGRIVMPILRRGDIDNDHIEYMLGFLLTNASDCIPDAVYLPGSVEDMIMPWNNKLDEAMYEAIAKSGVVPDLTWAEAEFDPLTGELLDKDAK